LSAHEQLPDVAAAVPLVGFADSAPMEKGNDQRGEADHTTSSPGRKALGCFMIAESFISAAWQRVDFQSMIPPRTVKYFCL